MQSAQFHYQNGYKGFRTTSARPDTIRKLEAPGGVADRLRVVAFAELQARDLFRYGAERFGGEVPAEWRSNWLRFAEHLFLDFIGTGRRMGGDPSLQIVGSHSVPVLSSRTGLLRDATNHAKSETSSSSVSPKGDDAPSVHPVMLPASS